MAAALASSAASSAGSERHMWRCSCSVVQDGMFSYDVWFTSQLCGRTDLQLHLTAARLSDAESMQLLLPIQPLHEWRLQLHVRGHDVRGRAVKELKGAWQGHRPLDVTTIVFNAPPALDLRVDLAPSVANPAAEANAAGKKAKPFFDVLHDAARPHNMTQVTVRAEWAYTIRSSLPLRLSLSLPQAGNERNHLQPSPAAIFMLASPPHSPLAAHQLTPLQSVPMPVDLQHVTQYLADFDEQPDAAAAASQHLNLSLRAGQPMDLTANGFGAPASAAALAAPTGSSAVPMSVSVSQQLTQLLERVEDLHRLVAPLEPALRRLERIEFMLMRDASASGEGGPGRDLYML